MSYWISTYVWDFISFLFPSLLAIILFCIFGRFKAIQYRFLAFQIHFNMWLLILIEVSTCVRYFATNFSWLCIVGLDQFVGRESFFPTVLLFLTYGLAIASSTYCLTFCFSEHSSAQVLTVFFLLVRYITCIHLSNDTLCFAAECDSVSALVHWAHSYGYIIHNGDYWNN